MMTDEEINLKLPETVGPEAKVWIYQATQPFSPAETESLHRQCAEFVKVWQAHGTKLIADYKILFNQFICLFVDESAQGATGCSIDSSVHFVQNLETSMGLSLMERTNVAFLMPDDTVKTIPMGDVTKASTDKNINKDSLVFNNLMKTKGEMEKGWIVPVRESWHERLF